MRTVIGRGSKPRHDTNISEIVRIYRVSAAHDRQQDGDPTGIVNVVYRFEI
jgi:hypothetical protein